MGRIYAIAINTFREAVRDKVLYGVLGFACAVLCFTLAIAELSLYEQNRVIEDVGLASISLFSVVVAVFLGSSLLYKEIERKTLYVILPKPISRTQFLFGKYVGILLTIMVFVGIMGALQLWLTSVRAGVPVWLAALTLFGLPALLGLALWRAKDRTAVLIPFAAAALTTCALLAQHAGARVEPVLAQLSLVMIEVMVLSAVAMLFSAFSTPFLTGVFTIGVWLAGRSADDMALLKAKQVGATLREVLHVVARVLPNLQLYVPSRSLLSGEAKVPVWQYVGEASTYGLLYATILFVFAALIFRRRDFL